MKNKKAVSPVISTILLIMIAVTTAIIILIWARGFVKEAVTKEIVGVEKRAEKLCSEIELQTSIFEEGNLYIRNAGNIPINSFKIKTTSGGNSAISEVDKGISPGEDIQIYDNDYRVYDEVKLIPVLLGKAKSGIEKFECPEEGGIVV